MGSDGVRVRRGEGGGVDGERALDEALVEIFFFGVVMLGLGGGMMERLVCLIGAYAWTMQFWDGGDRKHLISSSSFEWANVLYELLKPW